MSDSGLEASKQDAFSETGIFFIKIHLYKVKSFKQVFAASWNDRDCKNTLYFFKTVQPLKFRNG